MRLILSSGVEIAGVESTTSTPSLLEQLDRQQANGSWITVVRTTKRLGLLERQTLHVRAAEVIAVVIDERPEVPKKDESGRRAHRDRTHLPD